MGKILTLLAIIFQVGFTFSQLTTETVNINGVSRTYKLYVPTGFDAQNETPDMILILHGLGSNASDMVSAGFNYIADTARVIVVYPEGLNNAYGQSSWNNGTLLANTADDISFFHELIDMGESLYNVNPARVYATGFSMGSIMSHHIACEMNQRIAAIGAMAGTMSTNDIQNCVPAYKTPVIHLHGTADGTVPYDGTALPSLSLVPETIAFWQGVHGCQTTADSSRYADLVNDGITVDRFVYDGCNPTASLELYRFNGATHQYLYYPVNDITEILHVWRFLRQWEHSNPSTAGLSESEAAVFEMYPNPSTGIIQVKILEEAVLKVVSVSGKVVFEQTLNQGTNTLDLSSYDAGVYFIQAKTAQQKLILR